MTEFGHAVKQEMLESLLPNVYPVASSTRRRRAVKREAGGSVKVEYKPKKEELDIKPVKKAKKRRAAGDDDGVEFVGQRLLRRRPYQWRGRRVRLIPRPGVPIIYTPGQRSGKRAKRSYDEVHGDNDILEQFEQGEGEFAYGKRARLSGMPAPSAPLFTVVPRRRAVKRSADEMITDTDILQQMERSENEFAYGKRLREGERARLLPTRGIPSVDLTAAEVMDISADEEKKDVKIKKEIKRELNAIKRNADEEFDLYGKRKRTLAPEGYLPLDEKNPTPSLVPITKQEPIGIGDGILTPTIQVMAPRKRSASTLMETEDIKVRAPKIVAPGIELQTVDVSVPATRRIAVARKRRQPPLITMQDIKDNLKREPNAFAEKVISVVESMDAATTPPATLVVAPKTETVSVGTDPVNALLPTTQSIAVQTAKPLSVPRVRRTHTRRRRTAGVSSRRRKRVIVDHRYDPDTLVIPRVRYHPSIQSGPRRRRRVIFL